MSKETHRYIAIDLGAESGRVMLGTLSEGRVELDEVHRFPNEPAHLGAKLVWDLPRLLVEIERGVARGVERAGGAVDGIGVDSWGVDYGILDASGELAGLPVHYRDPRTRGVLAEIEARVPREEIFARTGIQFLDLNTLVQLFAQAKEQPHGFPPGGRLLLIAHLVSYYLSGRVAAEDSLASTTQLWNPREQRWDGDLLQRLDLPADLLPDVVRPGTVLAPLTESVAERVGLSRSPPVIAVAAHDTASAVAAVPADAQTSWAFLSSGTWSLLGVELDAPLVSDAVLAANFTNEIGAEGKVRFLKNLTGLWLLQECRRRWQAEADTELSYAALEEEARGAPAWETLVDPLSPEFFAPPNMPEAIAEYCRRTGQRPPGDRGAAARSILESLALSYRRALDEIESLTGQSVDVLHVVGGGSRNALLSELTADAIGRPVVAGPVEATAAGNVLVQAMATDAVPSLAELRRIVRDSFPVRTLTPRGDTRARDEAYARFLELPAIER